MYGMPACCVASDVMFRIAVVRSMWRLVRSTSAEMQAYSASLASVQVCFSKHVLTLVIMSKHLLLTLKPRQAAWTCFSAHTMSLVLLMSLHMHESWFLSWHTQQRFCVAATSGLAVDDTGSYRGHVSWKIMHAAWVCVCVCVCVSNF